MGRRGQGSGARDQGSVVADPEPIADQESITDPVSAPEVTGESLPVPETKNDEVEAAIKEAFSGSEEKAVGDAARPPSAAASKRVEVLFNGRLGPKLLTRGDITSDPSYVALLGDRRGLVREVISEGGE